MTERRKRRGMSQSAAARAAGVSRTAWVAWEKDAARPEDFNHVKIERALRWQTGSVTAALTGRAATPLEDDDQADPPPFELIDKTEREIWLIDELSPEQRAGAILRRRHRVRQTGQ